MAYNYGQDKAKGKPVALATQGSDGALDVATTSEGLPVQIGMAASGYSLNYRDIKTWNTWVSLIGQTPIIDVSDIDKMFDKNIDTAASISATVYSQSFVKVVVMPLIPAFAEAIYLLVDYQDTIPPLHAVYDDGTEEELEFTKEVASDVGYPSIDLYKYYPRTDKRVTDMYFMMGSSTSYSFKVREMYIFSSPYRYLLTAGRTLVKPTTPGASTEYSAGITVRKDNDIVAAVLCDQTPDSIVFEGSNDGTNYYELEGIGFDLTAWSTTKYNTMSISPYARFVRVRLTTPSTAPTALEMSIKEME